MWRHAEWTASSRGFTVVTDKVIIRGKEGKMWVGEGDRAKQPLILDTHTVWTGQIKRVHSCRALVHLAVCWTQAILAKCCLKSNLYANISPEIF